MLRPFGQLQIICSFIHFLWAKIPNQPGKKTHPGTPAQSVGVKIRCCGSRKALRAATHLIKRGQEISWERRQWLNFFLPIQNNALEEPEAMVCEN